MNAVVTGATSFLGRALVNRLLENDIRVYAVIRPGSENKRLLNCNRENLTVIERSLEDLAELCTEIEEPCDYFYHFGWDGSGSLNRMKKEVQQKNAEDGLKALEGARRLGCGRFLFSGSQAEYGIHQESIDEEAVCRPVSEYGKAKLQFLNRAEEQIREWKEQNVADLSYIHARIFSVYGPGDHPWSLVESCLKTFRRGEYLSLGECTQMWNFLYVDDCIRALRLLMEQKGVSPGIYNIAGPETDTRPLREYIRRMYELCGFHGSYSYGRRAENAEGPANLIPDIRKLQKETGWLQEVDFSEGIRRMINTEKY